VLEEPAPAEYMELEYCRIYHCSPIHLPPLHVMYKHMLCIQAEREAKANELALKDA
jgi:hypothetical protein